MNQPLSEDLLSPPIKPFGHLAHLIKDQLYWLEQGHLFTSPCVSVAISQRFYVLIVMSACGTPFRLTCGDFDEIVQAAVMAPGTIPKRVHAPGIRLLTAHINPLHPCFAAFRAVPESTALELDRIRFNHLNDAMNAAYGDTLDIEAVEQLHEDIVEVTARQLPAVHPLDPRIERLLVRLSKDNRRSLEEISEELGLSYHWVSRLFSKSVGLPLRTYGLWRKVHGAAQLLLQSPALVAQVEQQGYIGGPGLPSVSLTTLAHDAGFSDSAHLAHTIGELCGGPLSHFLFSGDVKLHLKRPDPQ